MSASHKWRYLYAQSIKFNAMSGCKAYRYELAAVYAELAEIVERLEKLEAERAHRPEV